jgi:hypothetical protein
VMLTVLRFGLRWVLVSPSVYCGLPGRTIKRSTGSTLRARRDCRMAVRETTSVIACGESRTHPTFADYMRLCPPGSRGRRWPGTVS